MKSFNENQYGRKIAICMPLLMKTRYANASDLSFVDLVWCVNAT
jgi:hypothetical protein